MEAIRSEVIEVELKNVILLESSCKVKIKPSETSGGDLVTTFNFGLAHEGDFLKVGDDFLFSLSIAIQAKDTDTNKIAFETNSKVEGAFKLLNCHTGHIYPKSNAYFWYIVSNYVCPYVAQYNKDNVSRMGFGEVGSVLYVPFDRFAKQMESDKKKVKAETKKSSKPKRITQES